MVVIRAKNHDIFSGFEKTAARTLESSTRGLEISGAVFWAVIFGFVMVVDILDDLIPPGPKMYSADSGLVVFAVVVFAMAYFASKRKAWSFLVNMAVGAFFVLATIASDGLETPDAYTGSLLVFVGLLTIYASYLGFLRVRSTQ